MPIEEMKARIHKLNTQDAIKEIDNCGMLDVQRRELKEWVENKREEGYSAKYKNPYYIKQTENDFINKFKEDNDQCSDTDGGEW